MAMQFCVLASGSNGNSTLLKVNEFGLLIDVGLGPRVLASRLAAIGASWRDVHAVLLTHTHTDHWKDRTLQQLVQHRIPLYGHPEHHRWLERQSANFRHLRQAGLVHSYDGAEFRIGEQIRVRPVEVKHDSVPTFGFRIEGKSRLIEKQWSIGYLADLGCWSREQIECAMMTDVLAIEFNHDERLERASNRPVELIERVLGDRGHLSNQQAADLLKEVLRESGPQLPRHLVQLHLSRDCNRPDLAQAAAQKIIRQAGFDTSIHTASQDRAGPILTLDSQRRPPTTCSHGTSNKILRHTQPSLPGLE
jgi:phosphoribosyl 1,2-cyclic phosphodiesterase